MNKTYIHLVSDSTGDTLSMISKTIMAQFEKVDVRTYLWALIDNERQLMKMISVIKKRPGIIMHTISDRKHVEYLNRLGESLGVPCIEVLKDAIDQISRYLKETPSPSPGKHHVIDKDYFNRIEAINFTISHDDGQNLDNLQNADIILFGPSRTSKSPTSMYLAYRGMKTANVPYVSEVGFYSDIDKMKKVFVVGLLISTKRLIEIRKNRLLSINNDYKSTYVDEEVVEKEMMEAKKICIKNEWPTIDITNKSIEETSAVILQQYYHWSKSK